MDENKRQKLIDLKYKIKRVCGNCEHSQFVRNRDWGTCQRHHYKHKKHTESERQLSIHRYGGCSGHAFKELYVDYHLDKFKEFLTE